MDTRSDARAGAYAINASGDCVHCFQQRSKKCVIQLVKK
jgi:hypothetical protein